MIIEPFHPRRYDGRFFQQIMRPGASANVLNYVWGRWSTIKHVWESNGWPFENRQLQEQIWLSADIIVAVKRRNLLKRYVSSEISRTLRFWIGKKSEFVTRLENISFLPLDEIHAAQCLRRDQEMLFRRSNFIEATGKTCLEVEFEELMFSHPQEQLVLLNRLFDGCLMENLNARVFDATGRKFLDPSEYKWSSTELYERIPNIHHFDSIMSGLGYGSLFDGIG